ncbi:putative CLASP domain, TOG domain-containing protein [Lupinus albus]|uniref:Putative CLASP domain, TOG domain-containing protein n=1 Tax=Lupinus albus TaxID=3870 RepID=A0A6A4NLY2_LUPAL|nr:putative CLASP domain, TOG domain-containing protein [Lupinus albus]
MGSGPSEESGNDAPTEIDQYDLVDPVDILTPLEKSGFWEGVKATKWSERKEAVAGLTKLASTIRVSPGDFSEVCRTLKKGLLMIESLHKFGSGLVILLFSVVDVRTKQTISLITDVNIAVAVEAIQAIGNLARGLRTHFSASSRFLLPVLLEKLKEKKPTLSEALTQTLQAMHKAGCISLIEIVEDVKTATKHKVPLVRSLTLAWVAFCIETSNKGVITKVHKDYVPVCMESLNDGTPEVRDAAFSVLAAIAKSVGMRPIERSVEKLDDVRRKKLSEMISGSEDAVPGGSATAPVHNIRAGMSSAESSESAFVKRSSSKHALVERPVQSTFLSSRKEALQRLERTKKQMECKHRRRLRNLLNFPEDVEPSEMSLDEIESRIGSLVSDTITLLKSTVMEGAS